MIYLILSIFCSAMISVVMRLSLGKATSHLCMIATNYVTCMAMAWVLLGFSNPFPAAAGMGATLGMGTFNGFFYMLALILNQYSISKNGVVLPSVFARMGGLLIPLLVSILIFGESPSVFQIGGFILSAVAVLLLNYQKDSPASKDKSMLSLFALLAAEGCAGIMSKVFNETGNPVFSTHFLFYTFAAAFLFCTLVILLKRERPGRMELLYGIGIGIPNFMGARFLLKALERVPAVIVYPAKSVGSIAVITLFGLLLFKEQLKKMQIIALFIILAALILLNLNI